MNMPGGWGPLYERIYSGAVGLQGFGAPACLCSTDYYYPRAELRSYYIQDQMIDLKLLPRQEALFLLNLQTHGKDPDQSRV